MKMVPCNVCGQDLPKFGPDTYRTQSKVWCARCIRPLLPPHCPTCGHAMTPRQERLVLEWQQENQCITAQLQAALEARDALREHVQHKPGCGYGSAGVRGYLMTAKPCSCGLDRLLTEAQG